MERARLVPVPLVLPVVVVSRCAVISTGPHATFLETYVRSRMGRDRSCQVSRQAPSRRGLRGNLA